MNSYEITVELKVSIDAFSPEDAQEAVVDDLNDLPGAAVTDLSIVDVREID